MTEENNELNHGSIISFGITKSGFVQIEYFDVLAGQMEDGDSSGYILLTKKDCETIAKLKDLI